MGELTPEVEATEAHEVEEEGSSYTSSKGNNEDDEIDDENRVKMFPRNMLINRLTSKTKNKWQLRSRRAC